MAEIIVISKSTLFRWFNHFVAYFSFYVLIISLSIYPSVYAFSKAILVEDVQSFDPLGIDYKVWLIKVQVLGYILSGFLHEKATTEVKDRNSAMVFLQLTGVAGGSVLLFTLVPAPYNIPILFSNGLALGMAWGLMVNRSNETKN